MEGVCRVHRRSAKNCPPTGARGTLIVAKQMIYYLDRRDAAAFVRSLSNSLAHDGRVLVEIFNGSLLSGRFTELKDPAILTAYTELGLKRLLEWNGLRSSGCSERNRTAADCTACSGPFGSTSIA